MGAETTWYGGWQDAGQLERLAQAEELRELTLLGNAVCLRPRHYALLRELLPHLQLLDGHSLDLPARAPAATCWPPQRLITYCTGSSGE